MCLLSMEYDICACLYTQLHSSILAKWYHLGATILLILELRINLKKREFGKKFLIQVLMNLSTYIIDWSELNKNKHIVN